MSKIIHKHKNNVNLHLDKIYEKYEILVMSSSSDQTAKPDIWAQTSGRRHLGADIWVQTFGHKNINDASVYLS